MSSETMVIKTTLPEEFREFEVTSFSIFSRIRRLRYHHLVAQHMSGKGNFVKQRMEFVCETVKKQNRRCYRQN